MKKALHAKPFRLQMPGHTPRHARPEPARSKLLRGVSLCLAAVCLAASVSFQPATAATSMASLQNKLNSLSKSIDQHKKELSDAKKKEAAAGGTVRQMRELKNGISSDLAKDIVKRIRGSKIKVMAKINGDELRISGRDKDDLQACIAFLKQEDIPVDLQFVNYR